jgi:hypothetical protein
VLVECDEDDLGEVDGPLGEWCHCPGGGPPGEVLDEVREVNSGGIFEVEIDVFDSPSW